MQAAAISLQFWMASGGPAIDCIIQKTDEWNKSQREYQVVITNTPGAENFAKPARDALALTKDLQPTFVLAPEYMTSTLGASRQIVPVSDILDKDHLKNIALLVQRTFGDEKGNALSLPLNPACGILYTNKDLMQKAGKDREFVPRTMEELEEVCSKLFGLKLVENGYTCAWPAAYLVEVPAAQQDKALVLPDNGFSGKGTYQLSSSWFYNHLMGIREQVKNKTFVYAGQTNDAKIPFINQQVAFFMQGSTHLANLEKEAKFEVGFGALPTLEKGQTEKYAFPLGGASIWVMDTEQTKSAIAGVRKYLEYLAGNDVQKALHEQAASVPVSVTLPEIMTEFYKTHPLQKAVVDQTINAKVGQFSYGIRMPNYGASERKALFTLIEEIVDIEKTPDDKVLPLLQEFDAKYSTK
ncbi:MAG: extracellular solute-binding protein [Chlamydiales bacterium]|nr:extracellular solute-binding protein [Chlamydiales bacterium]